MTTYLEAMEGLKVEAIERNMDLAIAKKRWRAVDGSHEELVEVDARFIPAGGYPNVLPGPTTAEDRKNGFEWDQAWQIVRCTVQPDRPTINLTPGKFLLGGMPNIVIE